MSNNSLRDELLKADKANGRQNFAKVPKLYLSEDGVYRIRILPSNVKGKRVPFAITPLHYHPNPNFPENSKKAPWVCLGSDCPMCKLAFKVAKEEKDSKVDKNDRVAWQLFAKSSVSYHVMDMNDEGTVKELVADKTDMGTGLHDALFAEIESLMNNDVNVFDANDGRIIEIERRTTKDKKRTFIIKTSYESHSIPSAVKQKLFEIRPLDRIYWKNTAEQLQKVLDGVSWRNEESEENTQKRTEPQAKTPPVKKKVESAKENLFRDSDDEEASKKTKADTNNNKEPELPSEDGLSAEEVMNLKNSIFGDVQGSENE